MTDRCFTVICYHLLVCVDYIRLHRSQHMTWISKWTANTGGSQTSIVLIACLFLVPNQICVHESARTVISVNSTTLWPPVKVCVCLPSLANSSESSALSLSLMCSESWHVLLGTFSCQQFYTHRRRHGGADRPDLTRLMKFMSERCYCAMDDSMHSNLWITNAHTLILLSELH